MSNTTLSYERCYLSIDEMFRGINFFEMIVVWLIIMAQSYKWGDSFRMSDMTHSEWVTWLIHVSDMTHSEWVTWLLHMSAMTHSEWVTWLIHISMVKTLRDTTHLHSWHDSFVCVTWHIHMCYMTHPSALPPMLVCECISEGRGGGSNNDVLAEKIGQYCR